MCALLLWAMFLLTLNSVEDVTERSLRAKSVQSVKKAILTMISLVLSVKRIMLVVLAVV
jgi:hypothetical protein